jgi:hypothetical protein
MNSWFKDQDIKPSNFVTDIDFMRAPNSLKLFKYYSWIRYFKDQHLSNSQSNLDDRELWLYFYAIMHWPNLRFFKFNPKVSATYVKRFFSFRRSHTFYEEQF